MKREAFFQKNTVFLFAQSIESTGANHIKLLIQTFLHRCYSFVFSVFKILYDLKVFYDFFQCIILNQLRLEEDIAGERFSGFRQPLSQIVDPDPQDQTLRHFFFQIFVFTKYCADLTRISDSNFLCGVDLKCCYSSLEHVGLVRILVCEVLNTAIFPGTSKMVLLFLIQVIYNRFKSFE